MKAMLLAAGLGKRMRPLTDTTPKPLLKAKGKYLIEYHLENLARAGIKEVVINTHWLGEQIPQALGNGEKWNLNITYSHEPILLETAGGIIENLDLLGEGDQAFLLINGDIFTDLNLQQWLATAPELNTNCLAYLALVRNPTHNTDGDFLYDAQSRVLYNTHLKERLDLQSFTYAGIAILHPALFRGMDKGPRPLGPLLKEQAQLKLVKGHVLEGYWLDVGTPERLQQLQAYL